MKRWLDRISERTARWLSLGFLVVGLGLLGTAIWFNLGAGGNGYTLTTYSMGSYVQQTVYGSGREEAAQAASTAVAELEDLISWRVEGSDIAARLSALAEKTGMLLMACDRCCIQREIEDKLVPPAGIGCFPNVYTALAGANVDQVITL